jgi:hypothetical protein
VHQEGELLPFAQTHAVVQPRAAGYAYPLLNDYSFDFLNVIVICIFSVHSFKMLKSSELLEPLFLTLSFELLSSYLSWSSAVLGKVLIFF